MSKVFYRVLIGRADIHLREVPDMLHRANLEFLTERSINSAIRELQTAVTLLEQAKQSYEHQVNRDHRPRDLQ